MVMTTTYRVSHSAYKSLHFGMLIILFEQILIQNVDSLYTALIILQIITSPNSQDTRLYQHGIDGIMLQWIYKYRYNNIYSLLMDIFM